MNTIKGPMDDSRRLSGFEELRRNVVLFNGRVGTILEELLKDTIYIWP